MINKKTFFYLFLISFIGCQDYNSNTFDDQRYGPTDLVGGTQFIQAYPIIQKRCISCHSNYHSSWGAYKNQQDWVTAGLVIPGDKDNSSFINRIINYGANYSDMPQGQSQLPASEYNKLVDWVENGY